MSFDKNRIENDEELLSSFTDNSLKQYMKDMARFPALSNEQIAQLINEYRNGDMNAREKIINSNLRLVINVANHYKSRIKHLNFLDIIQEGNLGLMRAIESYDPNEASFSTHAVYWIKQFIGRAICNKDDTIRQPVYFKEILRKYYDLINSRMNLGMEAPDDNEICEILGVSKKMLQRLKNGSANNIVSLDMPIGNDEDSELVEFVSNEQANFADNIINNMYSHELLLVLKQNLSPLLYYIFYSRIISQPKKTLRQLGEELGVTSERIRVLENDAIIKAKGYLNSSNFGYMKTLDYLRKRFGNKMYKLSVAPVCPEYIIRYLYVKKELTEVEKKYFYYKYLCRDSYNDFDLPEVMRLDREVFTSLVEAVNLKLKRLFQNSNKYIEFRKSYRKNYRTKIFSLIGDIKIIDYNYLEKEYGGKTYDDILNVVDGVNYELSDDDIKLLKKYYGVTELVDIDKDRICREVNLVKYDYMIKDTDVSKDKLYKVYLDNINDYNEEQKMYLECFYFNVRDRSESKFNMTMGILNNLYYKTIRVLEKKYYNIYRFADNDFTIKDYLFVKEKYKDVLGEERIKYLDLFYGVNCDKLSIAQIGEVFGVSEPVAHDIIKSTRNTAISLLNGVGRSLDLDKSLYIPYILDKKYVYTDETRKLLEEYLINGKSYDDISKEYGLTKYNISNIITNGIRKIDYYRFNLIKVNDVSEEDIKIIFEMYAKYLDEIDKKIMFMKYLEHMENSEISLKLGLSLKKVNIISTKLNNFYNGYIVKDVKLELDDFVKEINKHISESIFNVNEKVFVSYYYGIQNEYNQDGVKYSIEDFKDKFNMSRNVYYHNVRETSMKMKLYKKGLNRADNLFISRDELDKLLDDYHLPISDKERDMICYLFELKGYCYKDLNGLAILYNEQVGSLRRRYQRAIINIYKYINKEIEPKISYELDVLPNLKYFSLVDRDILNCYYEQGMTVKEIAKKYNMSFGKMIDIVWALKVDLNRMLVNDNVKKFDFDYYFKVRNCDDLPFYGDRELAIKVFDLFYGNVSNRHNSYPEIIKMLNLDYHNSTISFLVNSLMLSICKYKDGITSSKTFTLEDVREYYSRKESEMTKRQRIKYLKYFAKNIRKREINSYVPNVGLGITYDLILDKYNDCFTFECDRCEVVDILKKYGSSLSYQTRNALMSYYSISGREFMNGREINKFYKLLNSIDKLVAEKEKRFMMTKKD